MCLVICLCLVVGLFCCCLDLTVLFRMILLLLFISEDWLIVLLYDWFFCGF